MAAASVESKSVANGTRPPRPTSSAIIEEVEVAVQSVNQEQIAQITVHKQFLADISITQKHHTEPTQLAIDSLDIVPKYL